MSVLADIFRRFWPGYAERHGEAMPQAHVRAAEAILRCRTSECGTVFHRCTDCGTWEASPVSCGHRACNGCGGHRAVQWEARQKARLLPVPYHMVTFTVPSEFRAMFRGNQRLCYDTFMKECAGALMDLARDPKLLGGEIGMTGVLQTWTRDLRYHPHIHFLVPAVALTKDGVIRPRNPAVLVPVKPLAVRVRNRMREALKKADFKLYCSVSARAWQRPWNVDARPVGSGDTAFGYLARYIQKTALDAARIVAVTDKTVSFAWTDRESGRRRVQTLEGGAFLQRFLQHVLPRGFVRTRSFGFLSPAAKKRLERVRGLLGAPLGVVALPTPKPAPVCPCCGKPMRFVHCYRPARGPPRKRSAAAPTPSQT